MDFEESFGGFLMTGDTARLESWEAGSELKDRTKLVYGRVTISF